jgi:ABC-type bacteriocin/lantibiotic exporter with double-glycine peptidase domain
MRDADVVELSKTYKTHRVFKEMENGYLTQVGENGRNMSGGQKQQISFLRGIIKDSDIMLVDEPTANLDHHAEKEMIGAILKSDKTVLVIIHNFQYLSKFDKILGINNKKVNVYENYDDFNNDMHLY